MDVGAVLTARHLGWSWKLPARIGQSLFDRSEAQLWETLFDIKQHMPFGELSTFHIDCSSGRGPVPERIKE
jgi:hypothetical protein